MGRVLKLKNMDSLDKLNKKIKRLKKQLFRLNQNKEHYKDDFTMLQKYYQRKIQQYSNKRDLLLS